MITQRAPVATLTRIQRKLLRKLSRPAERGKSANLIRRRYIWSDR